MKLIFKTAESLEQYAASFAGQLEQSAVLILSGVMGAGKTTFVKGLAHGLGATSPVSSPTYTYIHEYETPKGKLVHIDAYRLADAHKLWQMGLTEYLETAFAVVIEWGEALLEQIPEAKLIRFVVLEDARQLELPMQNSDDLSVQNHEDLSVRNHEDLSVRNHDDLSVRNHDDLSVRNHDDLSVLEGVQYRESVGSTMDEVRQQALAGAAEFTIVLAETQTAGRGRRGKVWHSTPASGLYFTVLLKPQLVLSKLGLLPLLVGAVLARSIKQNTGIDTQLKWSNDLLTPDGRKLCGILLETKVEKGIAAFVLVGIGINVRCQDFPSELKAAALEEFAPVNRRTLLETCITNLKKAYQVFLENPESALQDWKSHSNNLGREIQILEPNGEIWTGIATDLDSSGGLVVCANGQTRILFAAEIS